MMTDHALVSVLFDEVLKRFPRGKVAVLQRSGGVYELTFNQNCLVFEHTARSRLARVVMRFHKRDKHDPDRSNVFSLTRPSPDLDRVSFDNGPEQTIAQAADAIYQTFITPATT